ncbi:MAG TPA: hypothetical protein VFB22_14770 [Candidatus Baltobacteraceae bacterium]|nr:hypothetical protein [Candidatus Baltobacteraceae bacterium]
MWSEIRLPALLAALAAAAGYGAARLVDTVLHADPIAALAGIGVVCAVYGAHRRGEEIAGTFIGGVAIAFAGYAGIAAARIPHLPATAPVALWDLDSGTALGIFYAWWPVVLVTGIPFALVMTVVVVLPFSSLPRRTTPHATRSDAFWQFVADRNARAGGAPAHRGRPVA